MARRVRDIAALAMYMDRSIDRLIARGVCPWDLPLTLTLFLTDSTVESS